MNWVPYDILGGEECKKLWQRAGGWNSGGYSAEGGDIVVAISGMHWLQEVYHLSSAQSWSIAVIMGNAEFVIEPGCSSREVKRTGGTGAGVTRAVGQQATWVITYSAFDNCRHGGFGTESLRILRQHTVYLKTARCY